MTFAPPPVTLRQLQYVVAVAEELSFRGAAERCRVSQPSLSAQLALVEQVLGVRLFERDRRRVLATAAGRDIVDRARRVLRESQDLIDTGRRAADPLAGTLRIGIIPTISPYLLPAAAPALRASFPRLTVAWREDKTRVLASALDDGEIDGALLALEADLGDFEHEVLATDPFFLVTHRHEPLGDGRDALPVGSLRGARVLLLDDGHCLRDQALEVCTMARAEEGEYRATSLTTLTQMVASGAGMTLLPAMALSTEVGRAGLRARPLDDTGAARTIALMWRRAAPVAKAMEALAGVLKPETERCIAHSAAAGTGRANGRRDAARKPVTRRRATGPRRR